VVSSVLSFAVTAFLLAMLPEVGQAVMTQQVLTHGRRPALVSSLGTGTGLILWSGAAAVGLSTAFHTYPQALTALRWLGGALLVAIGVRTILRRSGDR
jgi:threonine/homoserine/homoserine lactone efflux protein